MNAEKHIQELVRISSHVGHDVAMIQGGGGNTSVKLDQNIMLIKASGTTLSALTETKGFAAVNYRQIINSIYDDLDNDAFVERCNNALAPGYPALRPSIETGFHALLGKFVIHSHSVYANLLTCSEEGKKLAAQLFPDSLWIGFDKPGLELTRMIESACDPELHKVIFLENHGLVVHGESADSTCQLHDDVNNRIQEHFDIALMNDSDTSDSPGQAFIKDHILFPDQIVFLNGSTELLESIAARETIAAYRYIYNSISDLGLNHRFVGQQQADQISNLSSENYRRGITK